MEKMNECSIDNLLIDTNSRNRIVSETDVNFMVEAGAGSGKTTMLVNRMVSMVETGKDLKKICAITFTKNAANEFYDRFQKLLRERSNPDYNYEAKGMAGELPQPTEETRKLCAKALEEIDLCFMGTIDSFCNMILSEHPSEAKLPSDSKLIEEAEFNLLLQQYFSGIRKGEYGKELAADMNEFCAFFREPEVVFRKAMQLFMNNRNVSFKYNERVFINIDAYYQETKKKVSKLVDFLNNNKELAVTDANDSKEAWDKLPLISSKVNSKWSLDVDGVYSALKKLPKLRISLVDVSKYNISDFEEILEVKTARNGYKYYCVSRDKLLSNYDEYKYDACITFLLKCVHVIEGDMHDRGFLTYFDYLYYLRNMLAEDAANEGRLIRYISDRHRYYLIDEFQDTNPMQAEVFFYLTSEEPKNKWFECKPKEGTLFIVGDPKQSIYRFRNADLSSFFRVKEVFQEKGGEILYLYRNFRSTNGLISYFNDTFSRVFSAETEEQSKFEKIPENKKIEGEFEGVYTFKCFAETVDKEKREIIEQEKGSEAPKGYDYEEIGKIIQSIVGNPKYKIHTGPSEDLREIEYKDIMVISYVKKTLINIEKYLKELNIPVQVEGSVLFKSNEALAFIANMYEFLANPTEALSLYTVLKDGAFGYSEEEIISFKNDGGRLSLYSEQKLKDEASDTSKKIVADINRLLAFIDSVRGLSPAAVFSCIMDSFEIYRLFSTKGLEVVYHTLELVRKGETKGLINTMEDGAVYIKDLIEGKFNEERCLSLKENNNSVHLANLHKVKGLEAPVVILASCKESNSNSDYRIEYGNEGNEGYLFKLEDYMNNYPNTYFKTNKFEDKMNEEKTAAKEEGKRLIYVAATRARNVLIVSNTYTLYRENLKIDSYWKELFESGKDFFEKEKVDDTKAPQSNLVNDNNYSAQELYEKAKETSVLNNRPKVEVNTYISENPSGLKIKSKMNYNNENDDPGIDLNDYQDKTAEDMEETKNVKSANEAHKYPVVLGSAVHRLMEILVSSKGKVDINGSIKQITNEYENLQDISYNETLAKALNSVADTIKNGGYEQKNSSPKDILNTLLDADEVYCETPFCYKEKEENTIWNGVMDVIYRKGSDWHIVDYKTNAEGENLDNAYAGQLEAYKKAYKCITGIEVKDALIYHINV